MAGLTYKDAGVDIDAADRLVSRIRDLARSTHGPQVLEGIGGFASLFSLAGAKAMKEPVLVSGTDGVGTKLKLAFETGIHDTVGIDLVAMCVNDVITTGATPLFFLDYFGTGKLDESVGAAVVAGIAEGCRRAGCALVGGETAELPGLYADGEYDLAGFCVGLVDRAEILPRPVSAGDAIVAVESSGLHSNGFSLARKALAPEGALAESMLEPTRIYVNEARALIDRGAKALAHITGGGLPENLPRVLPDDVVAEIDRSAWTVPEIFERVQAAGGVSTAEMFRTFNMGVGLVAFLETPAEDDRVIGRVRAREDDEPQVDLGLE